MNTSDRQYLLLAEKILAPFDIPFSEQHRFRRAEACDKVTFSFI